MGIAGISLLLLVLAILIGFFRKINVGVIAILFAVILGYGSGLFTGKEIIAGFSGSLFLTLAGVTLLFAIVRSNSALELLMKKVIAKTGRAVVLVPIIVFIFSWLVSASGPGLIPTAALIVVLVIPIAHETGFHPVMLAIIGVHAANAGRFTMLTVEGNLVTSLLEEQGYTENIMFPLCLSVTILAVILSVIAYVWYKGYKVKASDICITGLEEHFTSQQLLSLAGMLMMAVLILVFKYETGLAALGVSAVLILLKVCDESVAIKNVPWGTIILVTGVGVLMNLVIDCGGIDILSNFLGSIMSPMTASALSGVTAGVLSWFSSTLGVVIPTLVPTVGDIIEQVGGNVTVLEIVAAIGFASSSAGLSPASTAGALTMGAIGGDSEFAQKYKADKLFVELFAWAAVSIVIIALIALTGYFRWFI
jgi:di/tricarboxylate transporter